MTTILLEIITPEKISFQDEVEMVSVPSVTGTLGILPGHAPLFTQLTEGELKIVKKKEESYYSLGGGFMEVTPNKVIVLVTRALHADEIDEARVLAAKKEAEEALKVRPTGEPLKTTQALLRSTIVDLKVLRRRKPPKIIPSSSP